MYSIIYIIKKIYHVFHSIMWKSIAIMSPVIATRIRYRYMVGKKLNLKNPITFTEKLQFLKLNDYYNNSLVRQCADKYEVREYVQKKGCGEILNEMFFVYDKVDEIEWEKLPNSFVLKTNHGCGEIIICRDKKNFDITEARKKLKKWMKQEYGLETVEYSYRGIQRKIICEKLIQTSNGDLPNDYKFFCSYGIPKFVDIHSGRETKNHTMDYYTIDWKQIPVINGTHKLSAIPLPKPINYELMLEYASKLSADFPFARIDLYSENNKIIFGEITFLPGGGCFQLHPKEYDKIFGDLFPINDADNKKQSKSIGNT